VEIDEKVHQADNRKNHPAMGIAVWIGGMVVHSIFPNIRYQIRLDITV